MAKRIVLKELNEELKIAKDNVIKVLAEYDKLLETIRKSAQGIKEQNDLLDSNTAKGIQKMNDLLEESNELVKQRSKIDSERQKVLQDQVKIENQLKKNLQEEQKIRQKGLKIREEEKNRQELIKTQIVQRRAMIQERKEQERLEKIRLRSIKSVQDEENAYKRLTRQRNEAQAEFKRLAAELGQDSNQAREALDVFNELDQAFTDINKAAKDGRPFVGRYADAIREASSISGNAKDVLSQLRKEKRELNKEINRLSKIYGENSREVERAIEQSNELEDTLQRVEKAADKAAKETSKLKKAFKAFSSFFIVVKILELISTSFSSSDTTAAVFEKTISRVVITVSVAFNRLFLSIDAFRKNFAITINELRLGWFEFLDSLNSEPVEIGGVEVFSGQVVDVSKKLKELRAIQAELGSETTSLSEIFAGYTDEINEKIKASDKSIDQNLINIKQNAILRKSVAELSSEIEGLAITYDDDSQSLLDRSNAIKEAIDIQKELNEENIKIAENELKLARARVQAATDSSQAQADFIDAQSARIEAEIEGQRELNSLIIESNSINRDIRDLGLDFFIDDVENRIRLNQELISSEKLTQEQRKALLSENTRLVEESFRNQSDVVNKELQDLGKETIDFNELLGKSTEEIVAVVESLPGETLAIRILEILRARRDALREITQTQNELADSDREVLATTADIILQEDALLKLRKEGADTEKILADLEKERFNQKIMFLEQEIALLEDGSLEQLAKEKELNDLLIQEEQRLFNEKEKIRKQNEKKEQEAAEFTRDVSVKAINQVISSFDKQSQERQKNLQEDVSEAQKRQSELISLANSSDSQLSQLAAASLAEQRRIEREKTQLIEEEKRKQARLEIIQAGIQAYAANAGQPNATGKTLADVGILIAGLSSLGSFFSGTDFINEKGKGIDNKQGSLNILHPGEAVYEKSLNQKMGFPSRYDVADVYIKHKKGLLIDRDQKDTVGTTVVVNDDRLIGEVQELKKEMQNISNDPQPTIDLVKGIVRAKERRGNRVNEYIRRV